MEKETYILSNSYFGKYYWALNYFPNAGIYHEVSISEISYLEINGQVIFFTHTPDCRTFVINGENRTFIINNENRTVEVKCQP